MLAARTQGASKGALHSRSTALACNERPFRETIAARTHRQDSTRPRRSLNAALRRRAPCAHDPPTMRPHFAHAWLDFEKSRAQCGDLPALGAPRPPLEAPTAETHAQYDLLRGRTLPHTVNPYLHQGCHAPTLHPHCAHVPPTHEQNQTELCHESAAEDTYYPISR